MRTLPYLPDILRYLLLCVAGESLFLAFLDTAYNVAIDTIWQKYTFRQKSGVSQIVCCSYPENLAKNFARKMQLKAFAQLNIIKSNIIAE